MSGDNQFNLIANSARRIPLSDLVNDLRNAYPAGEVARDITTQDTILHRLANNNIDPDIFVCLLEYPECGDLDKSKNNRNKTVLDVLFEKHMLNHLIALSVNDLVDISDYKSGEYNALHIAARRDNAKMISFLLKQGVDPNKKDKNGYTPLHVARRYACTDNSALLERVSIEPEILKKPVNNNNNYGMKR